MSQLPYTRQEQRLQQIEFHGIDRRLFECREQLLQTCLRLLGSNRVRLYRPFGAQRFELTRELLYAGHPQMREDLPDDGGIVQCGDQA
jgi:primosomal protein N''